MKYLSLFSGIGGFEYGIEQSRYADKLTCIGFGEIDKYAKNIYKKHYPNHPDLGDVTKIRTEDLPDFDFLVGGFPCQAFSVAGKRRGFDDTRGTLFFEVARILRDKKPKYFLLENVKGLLSHDKGRTFQTILRTLSELGYDVQWEIFNSKNHGVPQNRERIYIKGFLTTRTGSGREVLSLRKAGTKIVTGQKENSEIIINENNKVTSQTGNDTENNKIKCIVRGKSQGSELYKVDGVSPTLICGHAGDTKIAIPNEETEIGLIRVNEKPLDERDKEENRLYSSEGISPTLTASKSNSINITTNSSTPDDVSQKLTPTVVGNIYKSNHGGGNVYSDGGIAPTITCSNSDELKIMTKEDEEAPKINVVGNVYPSGGQAGTVYDSNGLVGTLGLSSGGKGGEGKNVLVHKEDKPANKIIPVNNDAQNNMIYDEDGLNPTITAEPHPTKVLIRNNTKKGYLEADDGDGLILSQPNGRGKVQKQRVATLDTSQGCGSGVLIKDNTKQGQHLLQNGDGIDLSNNNNMGKRVRTKSVPTLNTRTGCGSGVMDNYSIRKLTPIETERLQGFPDCWTEYGADGSLISDTQRYKCCGNAVTTNVVRDIINTWDMSFE